MVIKMKRDTNLRSRLGMSKLTERVLRLLKVDGKFPSSSIAQEAEAVDTYYISPREIRNNLLNAELRKAEALMDQRRRVVC